MWYVQPRPNVWAIWKKPDPEQVFGERYADRATAHAEARRRNELYGWNKFRAVQMPKPGRIYPYDSGEVVQWATGMDISMDVVIEEIRDEQHYAVRPVSEYDNNVYVVPVHELRPI